MTQQAQISFFGFQLSCLVVKTSEQFKITGSFALKKKLSDHVKLYFNDRNEYSKYQLWFHEQKNLARIYQ